MDVAECKEDYVYSEIAAAEEAEARSLVVPQDADNVRYSAVAVGSENSRRDAAAARALRDVYNAPSILDDLMVSADYDAEAASSLDDENVPRLVIDIDESKEAHVESDAAEARR